MAEPLPFEDVERTERAESEPALLVDVDGFEGPLDEERHRGCVEGWKAEGLPWAQP